MDYKTKLFDRYHSTHGKNIDSTHDAKVHFFTKYFNHYYKSYIPEDKNIKILEIGCNKGYLLKVLETEGYKNLYGIDLSFEDLEFAKQNTQHSSLCHADAFEFCADNEKSFDLIIIKAVLEHIEKNKVLLLIELMKSALRQNGILIIDVPNMDWLFATHERYMDFTHEVGFTKESLSQITLNFFDDVFIFTAGNIYNTYKGKIAHKLAKSIVGFILRALDPEGYVTAWNDRNLIAICRK